MPQRDKLWFVYPWPCVGQFKFVSLSLHRQPSYPRIVAALKSGARYLDIGCAVAQDMRYLVLDGCPSANMLAIEKMSGYVETAFDYFRDRDTLQAKFIIANVLDRSIPDVQELRGTVDIAHLGMVLHVWDLDGQIAACERILEFLAPKPGVLVVGNSVGRKVASNFIGPEGTIIYKHDVESFKAMWDEVGRRTGTSWKVSGWNDDGVGLNGETVHWEDPTTTRLYWAVERL